MAILSVPEQFASKVSVAAVAGTTVLGDVYNTAAPNSIFNTTGDGINEVDDYFFVLTVDTEIITGGSAGTVQFQFVSSAAAALTTPTIHYQTPAYVTGAASSNPLIKVGAVLANVNLPIAVYLQYLGVLLVVGTTTTTAGKVNAFMNKGFPSWNASKAGI